MDKNDFLKQLKDLVDEYINSEQFEDVNEGWNQSYKDSDFYFTIGIDINRYEK